MLRIARIELNTMFYSPVAWLVLVIFALQAGLTFGNVMDNYIHSKMMGHGAYGVTGGLFSGPRGLFPAVVNYLYLYIPLITMGLMSREFASGSIKLLFSSPIKNSSIILGKYLAILTYGMSLICILMCYVLYAGTVVDNFDWAQVLSGVLGIFLLLATYSAIGLFMSTITSYQVVAGMGTLAVLASLNYIGEVGQSIAFVRDITYWLSISGRVYDFMEGLLSSDGIVYYLSLIVFFISISIIKLYTDRAERNIMRTVAMYGTAFVALLAVAFISSRPTMRHYYDTTYTQSNTLANESLSSMARIDQALKITTYVNMLDEFAYAAMPDNLKRDEERFKKYLRFKPEMEMEYVYYWAPCDNKSLRNRYPEHSDEELAKIICNTNGLNIKKILNKEQIDKIIDLSGEGYHFVRIVEYGDGQKTILRMFDDTDKHPGEAEIIAALRSFVDAPPKVAIITGHSDRTMDNIGSRGYNYFSHNLTFRTALINQGFEPREFDLATGDIPQEVNIVVLADLKTPLSEEETARLDAYIARGGNLFLLSDAGRAATMNPIARKLGLEFSDQILVAAFKDQDPTLIPALLTEEASQIYRPYYKLLHYGYRIGMPTTTTVNTISDEGGFEQIPLLHSDPKWVWMEMETTDFIEDSVVMNPAVGEKEGDYTMMVALKRMVNGKEQRIVVSGDADCISNEGLSMQYNFSAANFSIIQGAFRWMSYDKFPIDTTHPDFIDNDISIGGEIKSARTVRLWNKITMMGIFPGLLLLAGLVLIFKRQRG